MKGQVTWAGKTSMEITMTLEQPQVSYICDLYNFYYGYYYDAAVAKYRTCDQPYYNNHYIFPLFGGIYDSLNYVGTVIPFWTLEISGKEGHMF